MKSEMTLTQLATELERRQGAKQDFMADTRKLHMTQDGTQLVMDNGARAAAASFGINDIAHNQLAERLGIGTRYYNRMRTDDPELLAANVNNWLNDKPENRMVRVLDGQVRAFLSDRYNRIENEEIAGAALPVLLQQEGVKVVSTAITDTRMYIKAVSEKVQGEVKKGDVVQAGLVISNSEVGMGMVKVEAMVYRLVCLNGMILPRTIGSYNIRHLGGRLDAQENVRELLSDEAVEADDKAVLLKVRDVVAASFDQIRFDKVLAQMQGAAEDSILGNPAEAVKLLAKKHSLSEFEAGSVMRNLISGADTTRWGLLNAVTATAKDEALKYDRATELEALGGEILAMGGTADWRQIAEAA